MSWTMWTAAGLALVCGLASNSTGALAANQISGVASFYSKDYKGKTASGEQYDPKKFTCAHPTLPFGTHVRVTDPKSHRTVDVTVNDRGPFTKGRVLDLSLAAAKVLRMQGRGLIRVTASIQ
jgi:rare lipoprotein A